VQYGEIFDTISICLSKGLGTPGGSVLLGRKDHIKQAHRVRKVLGGGMRQAGYFAAAGIYALDHNVDRLAEDNAKAKVLAGELPALRYVDSVLPVETNLVIFKLAAAADPGRFLDFLLHRNIQANQIAPQTIRFVFHLDISVPQFDQLLVALRAFSP
jgi:threonine aldolase